MNLLTVTGELLDFVTRVSEKGNTWGKGTVRTFVNGREEDWRFMAFGQAVDQLMGIGMHEPVCLIGELQMFDETSPYPRPTFRVRGAIGIPREEARIVRKRMREGETLASIAEAVSGETAEEKAEYGAVDAQLTLKPADPSDPNFDPFQ